MIAVWCFVCRTAILQFVYSVLFFLKESCCILVHMIDTIMKILSGVIKWQEKDICSTTKRALFMLIK